MKLNVTKEWLMKKIELEGDSAIGAGSSLPPDIPIHALNAPSPAGLTRDEKLVWILDDLMNAAENFYGAPNPKRVGHIYCAAVRILDEVLNVPEPPVPTVGGGE